MPRLEAHLRFEQPFAERRIVEGFGFGRRHDLVEDKTEAADENRIKDEHGRWQMACQTPQVPSALVLSPLQFQPDVDEVVRRPGPRVLERQLVEAAGDFLDLLVERLFLIA